VFALSSNHEGYNLAIMEAMAAGLPVVATDLPPLREGLRDSGLLVPPGDAAAMADALEEMLLNADLRRDLSAASRQRVSGMDAAATARRFERLLRHVLGAPRARRGQWRQDELQLATQDECSEQV
jgi:glycosyltransferase involved in cell wall biosynthesis